MRRQRADCRKDYANIPAGLKAGPERVEGELGSEIAGDLGALRLAVVIPAFNEAATVGDIVERCRRAVPEAELLVVDDGSSDGTAVRAAAAGAAVVRGASRCGKGAALAVGFGRVLASGAALVATLDADGQHCPEDLPRLLAASRAWPDRVVIGSRRAGSAAAPAARRCANRVADFWISWAARAPIEDSQSGFRIYPAELLRAVDAGRRMATGFAFESEMLIEAARRGYRTVSVPIPVIYGRALRRKSYFRPVADTTRIVVVVAGRLLRRGGDPVGLWQSLRLER
jgi:glycosyltransferase involved in cell wall biosynthesis